MARDDRDIVLSLLQVTLVAPFRNKRTNLCRSINSPIVVFWEMGNDLTGLAAGKFV